MKLDSLDYKLPSELIAMKPISPRDNSTLVEVNKEFKVKKFFQLSNILKKGDCLIVNDTKVLPAYLEGESENSKITITLNKLIKKKPFVMWSAFCKPLKKIKKNSKIMFSGNLVSEVININYDSQLPYLILTFKTSYKNFLEKISNFGRIALPPYILKKRDHDKEDDKNYQTIFSSTTGAVASPTANLHFSENLKDMLISKGIIIIPITLHVNGSTFLPVRSQNVNNHKMHKEYGEISKKSSVVINRIKKTGGRIIAVGTTVLRLLETAKNEKGQILPYNGETNIFIKPGWDINTVDGLITNFHTPKSSLLLIMYTILGESKTRKLYDFAIKQKLRFLSYGDACLVWIKK